MVKFYANNAIIHLIYFRFQLANKIWTKILSDDFYVSEEPVNFYRHFREEHSKQHHGRLNKNNSNSYEDFAAVGPSATIIRRSRRQQNSGQFTNNKHVEIIRKNILERDFEEKNFEGLNRRRIIGNIYSSDDEEEDDNNFDANNENDEEEGTISFEEESKHFVSY